MPLEGHVVMTQQQTYETVYTTSGTYPSESKAADGVGQHVAQQRGEGVESWEVGVHVGTLPVSHLREKKNEFIGFYMLVLGCINYQATTTAAEGC